MTLRSMTIGLFTLVFWIVPVGAPASSTDGLPPIADKVSGLVVRDGLLPVYIDAGAGKIFLEIPHPGREMLYEVSLPAGLGSNDVGLDRGEIDEGRIVRFERFGAKVLLIEPNQAFRAVTTNADERNDVETSFASSVLWGFPVVA